MKIRGFQWVEVVPTYHLLPSLKLTVLSHRTNEGVVDKEICPDMREKSVVMNVTTSEEVRCDTERKRVKPTRYKRNIRKSKRPKGNRRNITETDKM